MDLNFSHWKPDQVNLCVVFFSINSNVVGSGRELVVSSSFSPRTHLKLTSIPISPEMNNFPLKFRSC